MSSDFIVLTIVLALAFLYNVCFVVMLVKRPKTFWKFFDSMHHAPLVMHDNTGYEGMVFCLPFVTLVVFGCMLCFVLYGWLRVLVEG